MKTDSKSEGTDAIPSSDLLGTLKRFAVAVATDITLGGKHWYSSDESWVGMNLYLISAPDSETAEAIGAHKAIKHRKEETPGADISIQATGSKEVPNVELRDGVGSRLSQPKEHKNEN
jgi:hypothetical protein